VSLHYVTLTAGMGSRLGCTATERGRLHFSQELRGKITEREAGALFSQLLGAAAESSTHERMRMLCAALAGVWRPDLDAEARSE
jgi:hypothetical protein